MQTSKTQWMVSAIVVLALSACSSKKNPPATDPLNPYGNNPYGQMPYGYGGSQYPQGQMPGGGGFGGGGIGIGFPPIFGGGNNGNKPAEPCEAFTFADDKDQEGKIKGLKEGIYTLEANDDGEDRFKGKYLALRKTSVKGSQFQFELLTLKYQGDEEQGNKTYAVVDAEGYSLKENRKYTEARLVNDKENHRCSLQVTEKTGGMETLVISGESKGSTATIYDLSSSGEKAILATVRRRNGVKAIPSASEASSSDEKADKKTKVEEPKKTEEKKKNTEENTDEQKGDQKKADDQQVGIMPIAQLAIELGVQEEIQALSDNFSLILQEGKLIDRSTRDASKDYCSVFLASALSEELLVSGTRFNISELEEKSNITGTAKTLKVSSADGNIELNCLKHGADSFTLKDFDRILGSAIKVIKLN